MAKKGDSLGPLSGIVAFVVAIVPLLIGLSTTGLAVAGEPSLRIVQNPGLNLAIGWILVVAGIFSVYTFFTKK